jgi:hypothetical protein
LDKKRALKVISKQYDIEWMYTKVISFNFFFSNKTNKKEALKIQL